MYENVKWGKFNGLHYPDIPVGDIKENLAPNWPSRDCATFGRCPEEVDCKDCIFDSSNQYALRKLPELYLYGPNRKTAPAGDCITFMRPNSFYKTKGDDMNKNIVAAFPKTEDAVLVEKYLGHEIPSTFITGLVVKANAKEILAEAKRCEEEEAKK